MFDSTHQTATLSELNLTGNVATQTPVPQRDGAILIVVDSAAFDKYIAHKGLWYGPLT